MAKDVHQYRYKNRLWIPSLTESNKNSFFHSAFGSQANDYEAPCDKKTKVRRKLWSAFLSHFESESIPSSLATILRRCFSANAAYKDCSIEDGEKLENYADDVMRADHNVTMEEIPILATLNNTRVVVFKDQEAEPEIIEPNTNILGNYPSESGKLVVVVLLLTGEVFSRMTPVCEEIDTSSTTYEKSGNAGSKSTEFRYDILTVMLLNARRNCSDWKLSVINKEAGAFGDVVEECSEGATLVQTRHKEDKMEKITVEDLLSDNPKSDEFYICKYLVSYLQDVKKNFKAIKNVIICTNRDFDSDVSEVLNSHKISSNDLLYCQDDDYSFFTFKQDVLQSLKEKVMIYLGKKKQNRAMKVINDEQIQDFLQHLRIYPSYPTGNYLREVIEQLLSHTNLCCQTYLDLNAEIKKWVKLRVGVYANRTYVNAMILEIQRDKYWQGLEQYNVHFDNNNLMDNEENITTVHVTSGTEYFLQELKIYRALRDQKEKVLYVNSNDGVAKQKQVIEAFELGQYVYLVVVWSKDTAFPQEMYNSLKSWILKKDAYKKIILLSEYCDRLISPMELKDGCFRTIKGSMTLKDLSTDTQERLLKRKTIKFQGDYVSMEELLSTQKRVEDYDKALNSELLEKLVKDEEIRVGQPLSGLNKHVTRYYINRRFIRSVSENENQNPIRKDTLSEDDILKQNKKRILISDIAGMGKSTVLTNLAVRTKQKHPNLWVIRIELNHCTAILENCLKNKSETPTVMKLISYNDINHLEKYVFSLQEKIILMLDGFDEISPDYTKPVVQMLIDCKEAKNFAKIIVTTRPHAIGELEMILEADKFMLQPFRNIDQIKFLKNYWMDSLQVEQKDERKCEQYAEALINKMSTWTKEYKDVEEHFTQVPLQAEILAEVFQENDRWKEATDWKGCLEYLTMKNMKPKLPETMNVVELYKMFIDKKLEIFMLKANPTRNVFSSNLFKKEEYLSYHESLALKAIFGETKSKSFSSYREMKENEHDSISNIGIVHKVNNELQFIHRTFVEYFVSKCILKELLIKGEIRENYEFEQIFKDVLLNRHFGSIRAFFGSLLKDKDISQNCRFLSDDRYLSEMKHKFCLHLLAQEGCLQILQFLHGCTDIIVTQVNVEDESERTPLYYAAKHNHLTTAQFLVAQGADVNSYHEVHTSPLVAAIRGGHYEMVKFLVEEKADIKVKEGTDHYILYEAVIRKCTLIAEYLLNHILQSYGLNTEFMIAYTAAYLGRLEDLKGMIEQGLDVNSRTETGESLIFGAARGGQSGIIEYLTKEGADINLKDNYGNTALHLASLSHSHIFIAQLLIESGINLNVQNNFGRTAVHNATRSGIFELVELLIKNGAIIDSRDKSGDSPFQLTTSADHVYLTDNDGRTLLHAFAQQGELEKVKSLERLGMDLDVRDVAGRTPLFLAILYDNFDVVEFLVERGADVNIGNQTGITPLHLVAFYGHRNMVNLLEKHGAYIDCRRPYSNAALHFAAGKDLGKLYEHRRPLLDVKRKRERTKRPVNYSKRRKALQAAKDSRGSHKAFGQQQMEDEPDMLDTVVFLVEHGANVNTKDPESRTALHFAAKMGYSSIIRFLVENEADVNVTDSKKRTVLHLAADRGDSETVMFLIEHGADVNVEDEKKQTALHFSVRRGDSHLAMFLVEHKAYLNVKDDKGQTALHLAARGGESDIVTFLVLNGARVDVYDCKNRTPLHFVAKRGDSNTVIFLVQHKADVNSKDCKNQTALHFAVQNGDSDMVVFLVEHGAYLDVMDSNRQTALHYATARGAWDTVKLLVGHGADVNVKDNKSQTALHFAVSKRSWDTAKFLVEHGADVNVMNNKRQTALHFAAEKSNWDTIMLLVERGADVNVKDLKNRTALHLVAERGDSNTVRFLVEHGADVTVEDDKKQTALHFSAQRNESDTVRFLVEEGADVNARDEMNQTALHICAKIGSDSVKFLVEHGADVHATDSRGRTALLYAALRGDADIVTFLVEHGADVNVVDSKKQSALHFSAETGDSSTVRFLVERGANVNFKNNKKQTALHFATERGDSNTVAFLVEHGADVNVRDFKNRTAVDFAAERGDSNIVTFLVGHGARS